MAETDCLLEIHTLEARDNSLLDALMSVLGASDEQRGPAVQALVHSELNELSRALEGVGVDYRNLRTALVPQVHEKAELALLFDTRVMDSWYGHQAASRVVPLLGRRGNHSILAGDLLHGTPASIKAAVSEVGGWLREFELVMANQLYCIYLSNLSSGDFVRIVKSLSEFRPLVGYFNGTTSSVARDIVSSSLVHCYVKVGPVFIGGHEPDLGMVGSSNLHGWPIEGSQYKLVSVSDDYFGLFLGYKILRRMPELAFQDPFFSFAALTGVWTDPRLLEIDVADERLTFLNGRKVGSMSRAGLDALGAGALAQQIRERLGQSYIFSMKPDVHGAATFATMLEFPTSAGATNMRAVLKYESERLELVTLFG